MIHGRCILIVSTTFVSPCSYARWVSIDPNDRWMCRLHNVWSIHISYKLLVFAWLVIYQGIPFMARLAKSGLSDGIFTICHRPEMVNHIF
jgi:hypothetical protein